MPESKKAIDTLREYEEVRAAQHLAYRERWIKIMELRIVQEGLQTCHRSEGVNHYENCKEWSERYLKLLKEAEPLNNGQGPRPFRNRE